MFFRRNHLVSAELRRKATPVQSQSVTFACGVIHHRQPLVSDPGIPTLSSKCREGKTHRHSMGSKGLSCSFGVSVRLPHRLLFSHDIKG